jgi:hypothetical protein
MLRTSIGCINRPPLAMALIAVASWTLVTLMPCPKETAAVSISYQRL